MEGQLYPYWCVAFVGPRVFGTRTFVTRDKTGSRLLKIIPEPRLAISMNHEVSISPGIGDLVILETAVAVHYALLSRATSLHC